jgi:hypothetical protein
MLLTLKGSHFFPYTVLGRYELSIRSTLSTDSTVNFVMKSDYDPRSKKLHYFHVNRKLTHYHYELLDVESAS